MSQRDLIRTLVRRGEVARDQVNSVFRVDPYPEASDPEKKSLQLCRGSAISKKRESWEDADILARIPPRTPIAILERYESPLTSDALFVRYFVRLQWRGKIIQGWVHGDEITRQ
jgi:hypothetical protein